MSCPCQKNKLTGCANVKGTAYIKGNKGGKLSLVNIENLALAPSNTIIPWPYQKLRFALIFPPLPDNATGVTPCLARCEVLTARSRILTNC